MCVQQIRSDAVRYRMHRRRSTAASAGIGHTIGAAHRQELIPKRTTPPWMRGKQASSILVFVLGRKDSTSCCEKLRMKSWNTRRDENGAPMLPDGRVKGRNYVAVHSNAIETAGGFLNGLPKAGAK